MPPQDLNLNAYLARIGLTAAAGPSAALLRAVVARHTATIPFENLDIVLGRPIRLDLGSIQAKLVDRRRGGYCFEQNTLLRAALEALGFSVVSLMARVARGAAADAITPRTHMLLRIDLPEGAFLADAGFGNLTPTAPLAMDRPDAQVTGHEEYRLQPMKDETLLQVRLGTAWENVYRFSGRPSHPIDHEVGNWYTSTKPDALFTANVIAARPGTKVRKTLFNALVTIRDLDNRPEHLTIDSGATLESALRDHFGIVLDAGEGATVYAAAQRFGGRPDTGFRLD